MKTLSIRILPVLIAVVLLVSMFPMTVFAAEKEINLKVVTVSGSPGNAVAVKLELSNNPGIASLKFDINYDTDKLTLTDVAFATGFGSYVTAPKPYTNPQTISLVSPLESVTTTGLFATLSFTIADNVGDNVSAPITISYNEDDVFDSEYSNVQLNITNGMVNIYHGIPGDINADNTVNNKDAILLFQHVAGWPVTVDYGALDVNGDTVANNKDAIMLFRYVAGWQGITLVRGTICNHSMTPTAAKPASCTEEGNIAYWHCSLCDKYFSDSNGSARVSLENTVLQATGHTPVVDEAVPATYTATGLTEGQHCSVCGKILITQETLPILEQNSYSITYDIANGDPYLTGLLADGEIEIRGEMHYSYNSETGAELPDLVVTGYTFLGWFNGAGENATQLTGIVSGASGNTRLYAHWEKKQCKIVFDSPDVPVATRYRTIDERTPLDNPPEHYGYVFVGWTNDSGKIVTEVTPGTEDITLHANWTSIRNQTISINNLSDPIIIEDSDNAQFIFVYEIGRVINVPLEVIEDLPNNTVDWTREIDKTITTSSRAATTVADIVSNATTSTSSWTLSEDWNDSITQVNDTAVSRNESGTITDTKGFSESGKFFTSDSNGGSSSVATSSGGNSGVSAKVASDQSWGFDNAITESYEVANCTNDSSNELLADGVEAGTGLGGALAGAAIGVACAGPVGAFVGAAAGFAISFIGSQAADEIRKDGTEESAVTARLSSATSTSYDESQSSEYAAYQNLYWNTASTNSRTWNTIKGYEKSSTTSQSQQVSSAISNSIYEKYGYSSMANRGGASSDTETVGEVQQNQKEYSSTVEYCNTESITIKETFKKPADAPSSGKYRIVTAGTVHVFAVVGYDIATRSYFTYTYSVLDEKVSTFIDYTETDFTDCENGVLPFEVPYYVHQYLNFALGTSNDKMTVDRETGYITDYNPQNNDTNLYIPEYVSIDNNDGTFSAVRINGFTADAFDNVKNVTQIRLPKYVTEIPDNAFAGCTELVGVSCVGVTKIGNNAFAGCTKLQTFKIDKYVESLGTNVFQGVNEIKVDAANSNVAKAAISSGAARITLSIGNLSDTLDGERIELPENVEYFGLLGSKSDKSATVLKDVQIKSDAAETYINNITFTENNGIPINVSSSTVTLNRVSVYDAPCLALVLSNADTALRLFGNVNLSSTGENGVLCKKVTLSKENTAVAGKLILNGDMLVCGEVINGSLLSFTNGEIVPITEGQFDAYLTSSIVTFDANGGESSETSRTVYFGQSYGELPVPEREYYVFEGWYTESSGGTRITEATQVTSLINHTLFAHWRLDSFIITFDANGGTVSTPDMRAYCGQALGTLPEPTRDYYSFTGWYTAATGGSQITASSVLTSAENFTVFARWTLNPASEWVPASEMPADAEIVERKWTYDYSTTASSTHPGGTLYNTTSAWSEYGAWSDWLPNAVTETDSRDVETKSEPYQVHTGYYMVTYNTMTPGGQRHFRNFSIAGNFSAYGCSAGYGERNYSFVVNVDTVNAAPTVAAGSYTSNCSFPGYNKSNTTGYILWYDNASYVFFIESNTYETRYSTYYRYRDRTLVYTYYFHCETTSYPSGVGVTDVQEFVRYRPK